MKKSVLLICTVGGSPEPIVAALKQWRPVRVRFVHTPGTKGKVAEIVPKAHEEGVDLDAGRYDLIELPDEQDFTSCSTQIRGLTDKVFAWAARGDDCQVVVDITGGTKCMVAALAIQASHWPCLFSYVGGKERTKDGVGTVVSGSAVRSWLSPYHVRAVGEQLRDIAAHYQGADPDPAVGAQLRYALDDYVRRHRMVVRKELSPEDYALYESVIAAWAADLTAAIIPRP